MRWQEIRARYPQQWLLVEAIQARSESGMRVLEDIQVVDGFADSSEALQQYAKLHHEALDRELYVFHPSRDRLDVAERQWLGVRVAG